MVSVSMPSFSFLFFFFFLMIRPPPISTLFPYTTLFRSPRHPAAPECRPFPYPLTGIPQRWRLDPPPACKRRAKEFPKSAGSRRDDLTLLWPAGSRHILRFPPSAIAYLRFLEGHENRDPAECARAVLDVADCSSPHAPLAGDSQASSPPGNPARRRAGRPRETSAARAYPWEYPSRYAPPGRWFRPAAPLPVP